MRKLFALTSVFIISIALTGCDTTDTQSNQQNVSPTNTSVSEPPSSASTTNSYTLADVTKHTTEASCWIVIDNTVYDVSSYISMHPGGTKILEGCGKDATATFKGDNMWGKMHSGAAQMMLNKYRIGDLTR